MKATNAEAQSFKTLHVPGNPVLLANVYDVTSARIVAALPSCKALATASYAVALANGTEDAKLTLETQLATVEAIAAVAREHNKPLTVDLQDAYGDRLEEAVTKIVEAGAVGINLEDTEAATFSLVDEATAVSRIKRVLAAAAAAGMPDFVVNARSDTFWKEGDLDKTIRRGKAYLAAGATTVFVIGHKARECTRDEVRKLVSELDGKVNLSMRLPNPARPAPELTRQDLIDLGISRVSVGPQLYLVAAEALKNAAETVMGA